MLLIDHRRKRRRTGGGTCPQNSGKIFSGNYLAPVPFAQLLRLSNSLPPHVRSCTTLTTFRKQLVTSVSILLSHCLVTHPSASDSFAILALHKFIYLLTYLFSSDQRMFMRGYSTILMHVNFKNFTYMKHQNIPVKQNLRKHFPPYTPYISTELSRPYRTLDWPVPMLSTQQLQKLSHMRRLPWGNGGECPMRITPHGAPSYKELNLRIVPRKINKNCCHPSCTKSFVDWGLAPDPTDGGARRASPEGSEGRTGRRVEEGRSSSFVLGRKIKRRLWTDLLTNSLSRPLD